jgi:hypothetical protein
VTTRPFVSASRRTDLPAWYSQWLVNRIHAGFCLVHNPFKPSQQWRVDLTPEAVQALFLWTRNPRPLMPHLPAIHALGHRTVFQVTVTPYPTVMEPGLPPLSERIETLRELAGMVGAQRVWWRYDPIILGSAWTPDWHCRQFTRLARSLAGTTQRVTLSLVDPYHKTRRRLLPLKDTLGLDLETQPGDPAVVALVSQLAAIAADHGMRPVSCCEPDWAATGIAAAPCIDGAAVTRIFDLSVPEQRDPGQRQHCLCAPSFDIGAPQSCLGGCRYCYATSSHERARVAHAAHNPLGEALFPFRGTTQKDK